MFDSYVASPAPDRDIAAAIMVTEDGRYLLQLRDDFAHIFLPNHWGLFGGSLEPGESPEDALRREIQEELSFEIKTCRLVVTASHEFQAINQVWRLHFFEVPISCAEVGQVRQTEGAGHALQTLEDALKLERVAPWDLCAMIIHARHAQIWPAAV